LNYPHKQLKDDQGREGYLDVQKIAHCILCINTINMD